MVERVKVSACVDIRQFLSSIQVHICGHPCESHVHVLMFIMFYPSPSSLTTLNDRLLMYNVGLGRQHPVSWLMASEMVANTA